MGGLDRAFGRRVVGSETQIDEMLDEIGAHLGCDDRRMYRVDANAGAELRALDRRSLGQQAHRTFGRSEEHTSELQSLMRISYAVFCLKKKNSNHKEGTEISNH